jgi:hypothetical protein
MRTVSYSKHEGFSLLELVIVIILVVLLFTVAMNRLAPLRGDAEAAHVATVIGSLRSAIGMEAASRVVRDGLRGLAGLEGINPMTLLQEVPEQYVGVRDAGRSDEIPTGSWYFDEANGLLVYRVRFPQYLEGSPQAPVELRWQVQLQFEDLSESGAFDPEQDRVRGLGLRSLHEHRWTARQASEMQAAVTED